MPDPTGTEGTLQSLTGWGHTAPTVAHVVRPRDPEAATTAVRDAGPRGLVPRGLGRAYGDAAQNAGGLVVDCTALAAIHSLDAATGEVIAAGGASLDDIARASIPLGWFLPVTPGTRHVTVGGAIAADVHGKNHHVDGSFARHVSALTLLLPGGEARRITPEHDPELFWATAGGMGLTGVILDATIRLTRAATRFMLVDTDRAADLDAIMAAMVEGDTRYRYSVAWIDLVARGRALGRGVLTRGDHAPLDALASAQRAHARRYDPRTRLPAPPSVPAPLITSRTMQLFNELWFRKAPAREVDDIQPLETFFYPLDAVSGWNRAYGARGFLQWQCVIPFGEEARLREVIGRLAAGPVPVTLAVLKRFGEASPGYLSFPLPGWTLAADLPAARGSGLEALLDGLDRVVADGGGRIYLAKDARMRPDVLPAMYPRLDVWRTIQASIDPGARLTSDLDRRLGLTAHAHQRLAAVSTRRAEVMR